MVKPTVTPRQLTMYTASVEDLFTMLEEEIFVMVAEHLKTGVNLGEDYLFEWKLDKLNQIRAMNKETVKILAEYTGRSYEELMQMLNELGYKTIKSVDEEVKGRYKKLPPPTHLESVIEMYAKQTFREIHNLVNETLISTALGNGTVAQTAKRIIEQAEARVLAGTKTINQALVETVIEYRRRGVPSGFRDKGGRVWSVDSYARSVLRSTTNRTYNELRMERMDEYGIHLVRINSYPDARKACSEIQGKIATTREVATDGYPSIYEFGYGKPDGLRGINCRHIMYPFVEGVNINNEVQYEPAEARERAKLVQQQRYYERKVREAKADKRIAETLGDEQAISRYNKLIRNRQAKVREFVKEHDLNRDYSRERLI